MAVAPMRKCTMHNHTSHSIGSNTMAVSYPFDPVGSATAVLSPGVTGVTTAAAPATSAIASCFGESVGKTGKVTSKRILKLKLRENIYRMSRETFSEG